MELLTSLPAELVALADPAARGAAPLLRPAEAGADAETLPASFDACLALLAMPLPAGEVWPPAGKELPLATPPDTPSLAAGGAALDSDALTTADAALLARLRLAVAAPAPDAATVAAAATASAFPVLEADAPAPVPLRNDAPPTVAAVTAEGSAAIELSAAPAQPAEGTASRDSEEPLPPTESPEPSSWLDARAARDERGARPRPASGDPRLPASTQAAAPAPITLAPQPLVDAAVARDAKLWSNDAPKIAAPPGVTLADAPSVSRPEWFPSSHATATNAPAAQSSPVDVRTPGWQGAFADRVQWLVDSNVNEARITLHPPELGAVDIEISLVDDKTYVQLTASTAAARDELAQSLPRLRELFSVSGLELGGASVHDGRDGQRAGHGDGAAAPRSRVFAPLAAAVDEVLAAAAPRSTGRIDVFA